jgi:hypothetical protein
MTGTLGGGLEGIGEILKPKCHAVVAARAVSDRGSNSSCRPSSCVKARFSTFHHLASRR